VIPELDPSRGLLPPGRYRASQAEVNKRFVDARGEQRQRVWRDWESATSLLRRHVHLNAAWLGAVPKEGLPATPLYQAHNSTADFTTTAEVARPLDGKPDGWRALVAVKWDEAGPREGGHIFELLKENKQVYLLDIDPKTGKQVKALWPPSGWSDALVARGEDNKLLMVAGYLNHEGEGITLPPPDGHPERAAAAEHIGPTTGSDEWWEPYARDTFAGLFPGHDEVQRIASLSHTLWGWWTRLEQHEWRRTGEGVFSNFENEVININHELNTLPPAEVVGRFAREVIRTNLPPLVDTSSREARIQSVLDNHRAWIRHTSSRESYVQSRLDDHGVWILHTADVQREILAKDRTADINPLYDLPKKLHPWIEAVYDAHFESGGMNLPLEENMRAHRMIGIRIGFLPTPEDPETTYAEFYGRQYDERFPPPPDDPGPPQPGGPGQPPSPGLDPATGSHPQPPGDSRADSGPDQLGSHQDGPDVSGREDATTAGASPDTSQASQAGGGNGRGDVAGPSAAQHGSGEHVKLHAADSPDLGTRLPHTTPTDVVGYRFDGGADEPPVQPAAADKIGRTAAGHHDPAASSEQRSDEGVSARHVDSDEDLVGRRSVAGLPAGTASVPHAPAADSGPDAAGVVARSPGFAPSNPQPETRAGLVASTDTGQPAAEPPVTPAGRIADTVMQAGADMAHRGAEHVAGGPVVGTSEHAAQAQPDQLGPDGYVASRAEDVPGSDQRDRSRVVPGSRDDSAARDSARPGPGQRGWLRVVAGRTDESAARGNSVPAAMGARGRLHVVTGGLRDLAHTGSARSDGVADAGPTGRDSLRPNGIVHGQPVDVEKIGLVAGRADGGAAVLDRGVDEHEDAPAGRHAGGDARSSGVEPVKNCAVAVWEDTSAAYKAHGREYPFKERLSEWVSQQRHDGSKSMYSEGYLKSVEDYLDGGAVPKQGLPATPLYEAHNSDVRFTATAEVARPLAGKPDGWRALVAVKWKGGEREGGHIFELLKENKQVFLLDIDPKTGQRVKALWPPSGWSDALVARGEDDKLLMVAGYLNHKGEGMTLPPHDDHPERAAAAEHVGLTAGSRDWNPFARHPFARVFPGHDEVQQIASLSHTLQDWWSMRKEWRVTHTGERVFSNREDKVINMGNTMNTLPPEWVVGRFARQLMRIGLPPSHGFSRESYIQSSLDDDGTVAFVCTIVQREILAAGGRDINPLYDLPEGLRESIGRIYDAHRELGRGLPIAEYDRAGRMIGIYIGLSRTPEDPNITYAIRYGREYDERFPADEAP
jgi:hypothetical protein